MAELLSASDTVSTTIEFGTPLSNSAKILTILAVKCTDNKQYTVIEIYYLNNFYMRLFKDYVDVVVHRELLSTGFLEYVGYDKRFWEHHYKVNKPTVEDLFEYLQVSIGKIYRTTGYAATYTQYELTNEEQTITKMEEFKDKFPLAPVRKQAKKK